MILDKNRSKSRQDGFSLIQVIISMGIISLAISLYFQARQSSQTSRKRLDSETAISDVNQALTQELSTIIRQVNSATTGCVDFHSQLNNRPFASPSGMSALNFTQNLSSSYNFPGTMTAAQRSQLLSKLGSSPYNAVAGRCTSPHQPMNANNPNDNVFYLCLTIKQDSRAPPGTFLNSPFSFAEVGWHLLNLQTGANISCSDFAAGSKSVGAKVFYSVYWSVPLAGDIILKKHVNSFTLGK